MRVTGEVVVMHICLGESSNFGGCVTYFGGGLYVGGVTYVFGGGILLSFC